MVTFLIVLAVIVFVFAVILSLSATLTLVYDKKWTTKVSFLFIEKEISLSKILSFILFPEKAAQDASDAKKQKKNVKKAPAQETVQPDANLQDTPDDNNTIKQDAADTQQTANDNSNQKPSKPNPIAKIWQEEGVVGIFSLITNLVETANSAILTLIRGLHIYSLYVMIIVGGYDADIIGRTYGKVCGYYYPLKGIILNQMKVDDYDDVIIPDFLAEKSEFEFQLIASINVFLILKVAVKAGIVFLKNMIQNKKGTDK